MKECDSNMEGLLNMGVYLLQSPGCLGRDSRCATCDSERGEGGVVGHLLLVSHTCCLSPMLAHTHTLVPGEMDGKNRECVTNSLCKALRDFIDKGTILGFGFGIPCYVAGTAMFCACYACCCCRTNFAEDAPKPGDEVIVFGPDGEDDFPGAEFYPVPNQSQDLREAMAPNHWQSHESKGLYPAAY